MPDNIKVVAGLGDDIVSPPVATDLVGGQHYQRIKLGWGADGTFNEVTDTDGLRVPVGGSLLGVSTETAPASDTAASGLNGRLQRIAQRITSLIALLPAALGAGGGLKVDGSGTALPVSGTVAATVSAHAAATAVDAGDEAATDEAIAGAAANTRLIGFSVRETTGTAGAVFNIRHGTSNAGAILVSVSLGVNESAREWYGPDGIAAASGIWLERVTGQVEFIGYYKVAA